MKTKNKLLLTLPVLILTFSSIVNCAQAVNGVNNQNQKNPTPPAPIVAPQLVQQEINKVKALNQTENPIPIKDKRGLYSPQDLPTRTTDKNINADNRTRTRAEKIQIKKSKDILGETISQKKRTRNQIQQVKKFMQNIAERFTILAQREERIINRIESRITKLEKANYDLSEAKSILAESQTKLEEIKTDTLSLRENVVTTIKSNNFETRTEDFISEMRKKTTSLKTRFRTVHTDLVQSVKAIRQTLSEQKMVDNSKDNSENIDTTNESGEDE